MSRLDDIERSRADFLAVRQDTIERLALPVVRWLNRRLDAVLAWLYQRDRRA